MHPQDTWDDEEATVVPLRRNARDQGKGQDRGMTQTAAKPTAARLQLGMDDILRMLVREIWLMAIIFAVIFGIGAAVALSMPSSYTASASLLMQLTKDYVYDPLVNDTAKGAISTTDEVVQSEVEILNSTELKKRVIAKVGLKTVLPETPALWNPKTPAQSAQAEAAALKVLQGGFATSTAPQNKVVRLTFKHADAMAAALILNTLIDEYQIYRQQVLTESIGPALEQQKQAFDQRLIEADTAYQTFLAQSGVGDFVTAKATYATLSQQITTELFTVDARLAEGRARLAGVNRSLAGLTPEMSVERDLDLSVPNKIFTLKQKRQELLTRYLASAQPVRDVDAEIAGYEAMMAGGQGVGEQAHRVGVNPIYQDLTTQKLNLESEIASLDGRRRLLQGQSDDVTARLLSLQGLEGQYNSLVIDRDTLQKKVSTFNERIQENEAQREMSKGGSDAVRVVEKASLPDKPKSFKKIILIMSFLFAGFTALCVGGLRVVTRKGFVNADMASRALDLPVLATAGVKTGSHAEDRPVRAA
ncbi:Wzz/FepE/Etk N-terminal domain-containing protein [Asticcacaulis sp. AC402]|uniref:GumC family protein n=1 Tax=Asticcacaulis sp. AC402 TaxID=1282361 RepID=UPI0003C41320|nr:Wzz/FepE/Etk N-terminal domain-containing protein [Asticcacaulis sp. AC402]ESQ74412.1 lipopolysaccharide biosynthesis protein [Asticcacaulis sp. AC402]